MTADEKRELTTVRELVVNLDWLCALAKHCVASDERRYADRCVEFNHWFGRS